MKNFYWVWPINLYVVLYFISVYVISGCTKGNNIEDDYYNAIAVPIIEPVRSPIQFIWSVGIFRGKSPFSLTDFSDTLNPVVTAQSVTDIDAKFVADPFILYDNSTYYLFFEVLNNGSFRGEIGYATSNNGLNWEYQKMVLKEPFHLSYPYTFKYKDSYYMVPETHLDSSVRLYKASHFPDQWEYQRNLMEGHDFIDPCIIFYHDMWWLFTSKVSSNVLHLFYAENLMGPWKEHPKSPIVKDQPHFSRPGGRIFEYNGQLVRFAQDDSPYYGIQVWAFKITELTTTQYNEELASQEPVIKPGGSPWNTYGMHQVDIFMKKNGYWYAVVDGKY